MNKRWVGLLVCMCVGISFAAPVKVELVPDAWTGHCKEVEVDGEKGWQSERWKELTSRYFFFDVKDPAYKNGKAPELEITLTYFDTVAAPITFQYDSTDESIQHKDGAGAWKRGQTYASTGTGGLKTVSWIVPDAMFANRCGRHDFRVAIGADVDFVIKELVVRTAGDNRESVPVMQNIKKPTGFFIPEVFSDNMVLQRNTPVPVWGRAEDGTVVTVSFNGYDLESTARDGRWRVIFPPMSASSEPREMTIQSSGHSPIQYSNILIGDVWLASGQSNMEMQLGAVKGGQEAVAASANPLLRLFSASRKLETQEPPVGDSWTVSGPDTSASMSAAAWFFGREIQETQDIPVGILKCAYGGTVTETWCSPDVFKESFPDWEQWSDQARLNPDFPVRNINASYLYNRMLKTVMPFAVKGFLWYQGEGNAGRAEEQKRLLPAMIRDWREKWGGESLPFYFVQLARYEAADWHAFRCAQLDVWINTPNTYMAVTIDLSKDWNADNHPIHPTTKAPIGHRLALAARANVYGETDLVYSGPVIRSMRVRDGAAVLSFDHIGSGLIASGGRPLRGFYISADGETFVPADAEIRGDTVVVQSSNVRNPVAVRYGAEADMGKENLDVNLANEEGLPASPFTVFSNP
jgi:sialate O-acetylesterase